MYFNNHLVLMNHCRVRHLIGLFLTLFLLVSIVKISDAYAGIKTELISAAGPDYEPLSFQNTDGQADGFAIDLLHAVVQSMGQEVLFDVRPWSQVNQELVRGQLDVLPLVARTPEREKRVDFSVPYLTLHGAIIMRKGAQPILGMNELKYQKIGVMKDDIADEFMRSQGFSSSLVSTQTYRQALNQLQKGSIDAVVMQELVASELIKELAADDLEIVARLRNFRQDWCFAVPEDNKETLALLNEGLSKVLTNGTYKKLKMKWLPGLESTYYLDDDSSFALTIEEKNWILNNSEISFTGNPNWFPYEAFDKDGNYVGIVADHLALIQEKTGLKFKPILVESWAESLKIAADGQVSVISGDSSDKVLSQRFNPVLTYKSDPIVIISDSRHHYIDDFNAIHGRKVAIIKNHYYVAKLITYYPNFDFIEVETIDEGFKGVADGRFNALLITMSKATYNIAKMDLFDIKVVGKIPNTLDLSLFVSKEQPILQSIIEKALNSLSSFESEYIMHRWLHHHQGDKTDHTLIAQISISLLLLIFLMLFWNRRLHMEVKTRKATENALKDSERFLAEAQAIAHIGNWWLNIETGELFWSDEIYRLFGRYPNEFEPTYGRFYETVHPDDFDAVKMSEEKAFAEQQPHSIDHRIILPKGEIRWVHEEARPTFNDEGKLTYLAGTVQDITERKEKEQELQSYRKNLENLVSERTFELKQSETRFRSLFELSLDAIILLDRKEILDCNSAALELFDCPDVTLFKALYPFKLFPAKQPGGTPSHIAALEKMKTAYQDGNCRFEWQFWKHGSHQTFFADVQLNYIDLGEFDVLQAVVRDISERKQMEYKLFEERDKAEQANIAKSLFLANMSHEIRTPMNAIMGMTHLALQTELNSKQRNYVMKAHQSAENMLGILNDILDFSKIEARKLDLENSPFQLKEVLKNMRNLMRIKVEEKGILLSIDMNHAVPDILIGDSLRISQILINLTNNAVKFTPEGGSVDVCVDVKEVTGFDVILHFSIIDTGIGLSAKQQRKLFQPFSQADNSTTRQYGGTGLGLAISRQLVKLMGGDIWLDSQINEGSTFHFTIKVKKPTDIKLEEIFNAGKEQVKIDDIVDIMKGARILLVEDNEINQELAFELLDFNDITVLAANNGKEALEILEQQAFDCVLMDCQMPVMDGYEATLKIREQEKYNNLPIIAMTANAMKQDVEKVLAVGMNDHIPKPINPELMYATVAKWIGQAR